VQRVSLLLRPVNNPRERAEWGVGERWVLEGMRKDGSRCFARLYILLLVFHCKALVDGLWVHDVCTHSSGFFFVGDITLV
jgi:hypothetical protein